MTGLRILLPVVFAVACIVAAVNVVPRGYEAQELLFAQDDPEKLADRGLDGVFTPAFVRREIEAALAADDADLAKSFLDLAHERHVAVDPTLAAKVEAANSTSATAVRAASNFARGLIVGEPDDLSGLAGTAVGDLFVIGDIRDAVREGTRFATGETADELVLGLACVGLAVTAGTYASFGMGAPARAGLTLVKAARKTGRVGAEMAEWIGRSLREVVDWSKLRGSLRWASLTEPTVAVRAARDAVKVEKSDALVKLVGDVGRVQSRAGTKAAFDGLKLAQGPGDMARVARLATAKGGKTRAILKTLGRSAFLLTTSAFNLFSWMLSAVFTILGFCASCKRTAERATERYCHRRKLRRARQQHRIEMATAQA